MFESVYTEHLKGRKVLLETPTGFAVFLVKDFAFEQDKVICCPLMNYPASFLAFGPATIL
jgi:hypothetical protein